MNRKGIALLVALMVIALAGAVLAAVLTAVTLEVRATRAAVIAVQAEAILSDLREEVLADSVPLRSAGGVPTAWRPEGTSTVLGAIWAGEGPDSLVWLYLAASEPAVRVMMLVAGLRGDTSGVGHLRPLDRRANIYPFF